MVVVGDADLDENYVVKTPYNGTGDAGGDPMVHNMNIWYEVRDSYRAILPQGKLASLTRAT